MEVNPSGKVMLRRLLHPEKASPSKEVSLSGKLMLHRLLHPWKAHSSMEVRPSRTGRLKDARTTCWLRLGSGTQVAPRGWLPPLALLVVVRRRGLDEGVCRCPAASAQQLQPHTRQAHLFGNGRLPQQQWTRTLKIM